MYIDTRDLETTREELKQQILESFLETFPQYEDMTESFEDIRFEEEEIESWKSDWEEELKQIEEINAIENDCSEFSFGETLIDEDEFEDYCQDFVNDCYGLRDIPSIISNNIDWAGIAFDMKQDYSECEYQGDTYLYRS